jgi:hypothetical protein
MADKKTSGSKKPARRKRVPLEDLSGSNHELSEGQAKAVKGGGFGKAGTTQPNVKVKMTDVIVTSHALGRSEMAE